MDYYSLLLQPIPGDAPCGVNLEYDPAFIMLQSRLEPRLDAEYGEFVEAADPINWAEIERDCHALLAKSRDIRLIIILMRCRLRIIGLSAINEGLQVLLALLRQWPDELYPQLLDEGEFEPLLRANAFNELNDLHGFINDLRQHALPRAVGVQSSVKDIERALATPRDDNALPEATVRAMQTEWRERGYEEITSLSPARETLHTLVRLLGESLGEMAPTFSHLSHLLELFCDGQRSSVSPPEEQTPTTAQGSVAVADAATFLGSDFTDEATRLPPSKEGIQSRAQALACLKEVQAWFVGTEPGTPIILLIEFTLKASGKNFTELTQLLPIEIVSHLNNAGKM